MRRQITYDTPPLVPISFAYRMTANVSNVNEVSEAIEAELIETGSVLIRDVHTFS